MDSAELYSVNGTNRVAFGVIHFVGAKQQFHYPRHSDPPKNLGGGAKIPRQNIEENN